MSDPQRQQNAPRPSIKLPSFREVQAAQRPTAAPDLFAARNLQAQSSTQPRPPAPASARPQPPPPNSHPQVEAPAPHSSMPHRPAAPGLSSTAPQAPPPQPQGQTQAQNVNPNAILVSRRQEGNPLLRHIRNVRWQFDDIVPDYVLGANHCALFLSLRFHLLKPEYIHGRIRELQRAYTLRLLLCFVDIEDVVLPLGQIIKAALLNHMTLVCAWSPQECARYLETYKIFETKPADAIQGRSEEDYLSRLSNALTAVRGVNRTDVLTLGGTFQTAAGIMQAGLDDLIACPGIGPTKIRRLYDAFHEPFRKVVKAPEDNAEAAQEQGKVQLTLSPTQQKKRGGRQGPSVQASQQQPEQPRQHAVVPDSEEDDGGEQEIW